MYLVAAELTRLGFVASPTSRSAIGADILATDQACVRTYSVQVKTNAKTFKFWLLNAKSKSLYSETHIYVFVNIRGGNGGEVVEYYVVPSKVVADGTVHSKGINKKQSEWYQFNIPEAKPYQTAAPHDSTCSRMMIQSIPAASSNVWIVFRRCSGSSGQSSISRNKSGSEMDIES